MPRLLFLLLPWILSACASGPTTSNASEEAKQNELASDPRYKLAESMDRLLHNKMPPEELTAVVSQCKAEGASGTNPFCPGFLRAKELTRVAKYRSDIPTPFEPKQVEPAQIVWDKGRVKNWKKLRREKISSLLKAIETLPREQLSLLSKLALKERLCPNNVAVSVAATLEDYLPDHQVAEEISELYEKGGRCSARKSPDREHFYTRAGLFLFREKKFTEAAKLFEKATPSDAMSGRALYWLFRTSQSAGNTQKAEKTLQRLLGNYRFSFHALVAAGLTGQDICAKYLLAAADPPLMTRSQKYKKLNAFIEQAELLKKYGFEESSSILGEWAISKYPRAEVSAHVYLASLGDSHFKVAVVPERLIVKPSLIRRETLELAFPKAYWPSFERHSSLMDPLLLLAVARKESRFDPKAVSPANAQGLMQIQTATASRVSGGTPNLLEPDSNIQVGAKYLNRLSSAHPGPLSLPLALASYNAGEDPVQRWVKRYPGDDPTLFVDLIPYRETRDYVGYVLANYYWYLRLYDNSGQNPLKPFMGEIALKN